MRKINNNLFIKRNKKEKRQCQNISTTINNIDMVIILLYCLWINIINIHEFKNQISDVVYKQNSKKSYGKILLFFN